MRATREGAELDGIGRELVGGAERRERRVEVPDDREPVSERDDRRGHVPAGEVGVKQHRVLGRRDARERLDALRERPGPP